MDEPEDAELEKEDLDDFVVAEESAQESVKTLRARLKDVELKAKEYLNGWQRSQADFANFRRRDEEAKGEFVKFAQLSLIQELIPVLDSFNIALSQGHKDLEPLYQQLMAVLKTSGLEEIQPFGAVFSPVEHEALGTIPTQNETNDHKVLEVLQRGYKLNMRIIRAAKVKIGEFKS